MPPYKYEGPVDCTTPINASSLKGKVAIVTGGANGIGEAYVRALVANGALVCVGDLNVDKGSQLAVELPNVKFVQCDTTNWDNQLKLFEEAKNMSPSGRVSYVVANAGVIGPDGVFDITSETPSKPNLKTVDVNVTGSLYTTKLALHHFVKQNGTTESPEQEDQCLVLIGSGASHFDGLRAPQYWASKFAMRGLLHALRRTMYHSGSRINLIAPYYIKTSILSEETFEAVKKKGIVFAELEDAQRCLLRILSDNTMNGRSLFVGGKKWAPQGFWDLDVDDYKDPLLEEVQIDQLRSAPAELGLFVD